MHEYAKYNLKNHKKPYTHNMAILYYKQVGTDSLSGAVQHNIMIYLRVMYVLIYIIYTLFVLVCLFKKPETINDMAYNLKKEKEFSTFENFR